MFFRGSPEWQGVLAPDLFALFLSTFDRLYAGGATAGVSQSVRECLVQLATATSVFPNAATGTPYVHAGVSAFLGAVERCAHQASPDPGTMLSFATFVARLVGAFGFDRLAVACDSGGVGGTGRFVDAMLTFTTLALRAMVTLPTDGNGGGAQILDHCGVLECTCMCVVPMCTR